MDIFINDGMIRRKYIVTIELKSNTTVQCSLAFVAHMRLQYEEYIVDEVLGMVAYFDFLTLCMTHVQIYKHICEHQGIRCDFLMTLYSVSLSIVKWIIYALHMPAIFKKHLKYDTS